jgi:hypothetical protein
MDAQRLAPLCHAKGSTPVTASPPLRTIELERAEDLYELHHVDEGAVRFIHVPDAAFLAIDGTEQPGGEVYLAAIGTIYQVAHQLHDALERRDVHTRVGMLEGLYWLRPEELLDGEEPGRRAEKDYHWRWRLLVAVPPEASEFEVESAIRSAAEHGPLPSLDRLHLLRWEEGPAAQVLHVGPYLAETPDIRHLHAAIADAGYEAYGQHHEIYLNNPQEVGDENARTVIRRPIRWADESDGA